MNDNIINFEVLKDSFVKMEVQNNAYRNAVWGVENFLIGLDSVALPYPSEFNNNPANYEKIRTCYNSIKEECASYTTKIHQQLLDYPSDCLSTLQRIDLSIEASISKVDILCTEGMPQKDIDYNKKMLLNYIDEIIRDSDSQIKLLNILCNNLDIYRKERIINIENDLVNLVNELTLTSNHYTDAAKALEKLIEELQTTINELIAGITGGAVGIVTVIVFGVAAICITVGSGGTAVAVGVVVGILATAVGALAAMGATALDSYMLVDAQNELENKAANLTNYEADILLLNATQKNFSAYCNEFVKIQISLDTIAGAWNDVNGGFKTIKNKILYAQKEISVQEWQKVNNILKECQRLSTETAKMLEDLKIEDTAISKASFKIGMAEDDVSQAVESADQVTFTEYMLAI